MFKKVFWSIGVLVLVIGISGTAMAILAPPPGPISPVTQFPAFYSDTNGVSLGLCLDLANCFFDPIVPGNAFSAQIGFGGEAFYWGADVVGLLFDGIGSADLVLALEAGFPANPGAGLGGTGAPGDPDVNFREVFSRIRLRIDTGTNNGTNLPATFTIIHPFGTIGPIANVPPNTLRAINVTVDVPAVPLDFAGAINGGIGPFLRWDPAVPPLAPAGFLGISGVPHAVINSPTGNNFFAIQVDGTEVVRTTQFDVQGQIANNLPGPDIGIFRAGRWFQDLAGNGIWEGCLDATVGGVLGPDRCQGPFGGLPQDKPVVGRWVAAQPAKIGIFRDGNWFLDANGNGLWDGEPTDDVQGPFGGLPQDVPIAGRWSIADASDSIGIFRDGNWFLDANGNGTWDGVAGGDLQRGPFGGAPGDVPVVGDWTGDGITKIGIYRGGQWFLDNGDGIFNGCGGFPAQDRCIPSFGGAPGDIPVTGIWTRIVGDNIHKIGIVRGNKWFLDFDNSGTFTACGAEACVESFGGAPGDIPITGRWQ